MAGHLKHFEPLDLSSSRQATEVIDYEPEPPLDIDLRPLSGQELKEWRTQYTTMSQKDLGRWAGLVSTLISSWETGAQPIPRHWSALLRERAIRPSFELPEGPVGPPIVRALSKLLGGHRHLADALCVNEPTVRTWSSEARPETPSRGGTGPLLRWLFEDFGLEPCESLGPQGRPALTDQQVAEMRRRAARGESGVEIASDYDAAPCTVYRAIRGDFYAQIGRAHV